MPPPPTFSNPPLPKRDWNDYKPSAIKKKDIAINGLAFTLDNVFTQDECKDIIDWSENLGYIPAALGHGTRVVSHVRKSDRCLIDTPELANIIFQRIRRYLPKQFNGGNLIEVNERLRCLRYDPGGFFRKHADGFYERPDRSAISQITVQFYLNEGFEGGETTFYVNRDNKKIPCIPKTGRILVFEHKLIHEGSKLISGRKYTIRSDVMYTQVWR